MSTVFPWRPRIQAFQTLSPAKAARILRKLFFLGEGGVMLVPRAGVSMEVLQNTVAKP